MKNGVGSMQSKSVALKPHHKVHNYKPSPVEKRTGHKLIGKLDLGLAIYTAKLNVVFIIDSIIYAVHGFNVF